jgi:hypothetical protein
MACRWQTRALNLHARLTRRPSSLKRSVSLDRFGNPRGNAFRCVCRRHLRTIGEATSGREMLEFRDHGGRGRLPSNVGLVVRVSRPRQACIPGRHRQTRRRVRNSEKFVAERGRNGDTDSTDTLLSLAPRHNSRAECRPRRVEERRADGAAEIARLAGKERGKERESLHRVCARIQSVPKVTLAAIGPIDCR